MANSATLSTHTPLLKRTMFGFPVSEKPESLRFSNNLLQSATFQIKYPSVDVRGSHEAVIDAVIKVLPHVKGVAEQQFVLTTGKTSSLTVEGDPTPKGLDFKSEDNGITFSVRANDMTLTIVGGSYVNFNTTQALFEKTFYAVADILGIATLTRVAIRKVNLIGSKVESDVVYRFDQLIQSVFNDDLIGPATLLPPAPYLESSVGNCHFRSGQDHLNLIFGLLPEQAELPGRQLLLDIDVFSTPDGLPISDAREMMQTINNELFNVFMWALKPRVKELLQ
jgi:uncharacterized protein (TIGR04255 family)